jgi:hypothetical protein
VSTQHERNKPDSAGGPTKTRRKRPEKDWSEWPNKDWRFLFEQEDIDTWMADGVTGDDPPLAVDWLYQKLNLTALYEPDATHALIPIHVLRLLMPIAARGLGKQGLPQRDTFTSRGAKLAAVESARARSDELVAQEMPRGEANERAAEEAAQMIKQDFGIEKFGADTILEWMRRGGDPTVSRKAKKGGA